MSPTEAAQVRALDSRVGEVESTVAQQSWIWKHPAKAFTIAVGVLSVLWGGIQWYAQTRVSTAVSEEQTARYRSDTTAEIGNVKTEVESFKREASRAHKELDAKIQNVGEALLLMSRDQRKILIDLAKRNRVRVDEESEELEEAKKKLGVEP